MKETELSQLWKERVSGWQVSGKSIAQWCKDHSLPEHQFYYWKDRLNGKKRNGSKPPTDNKFIRLQDDDQAQSGIVLEMAGAQLHISPGFDENTLIRCLHILGRSA